MLQGEDVSLPDVCQWRGLAQRCWGAVVLGNSRLSTERDLGAKERGHAPRMVTAATASSPAYIPPPFSARAMRAPGT
jgi:hypothetical protein